MNRTALSLFVKNQRKQLKITQEQLSIYSGVGLGFVRALEQGKPNLNMAYVNRVLNLFGYEVGPVKKENRE